MWSGNCFDHSQIDPKDYAKSDYENRILEPSAIRRSVYDNSAKRQGYLDKLLQE
jgi:hypothetical protein